MKNASFPDPQERTKAPYTKEYAQKRALRVLAAGAVIGSSIWAILAGDDGVNCSVPGGEPTVVQPGDTAWELSGSDGRYTHETAKLNPGVDVSSIDPGDLIFVCRPPGLPEVSVVPEAGDK